MDLQETKDQGIKLSTKERQAIKRHDELVKELKHLVTELNLFEFNHHETIVLSRGPSVRNVEVIYLKDVILLQENGEDSLDRTGFVWASDENWAKKAATTINRWMGISED